MHSTEAQCGGPLTLVHTQVRVREASVQLSGAVGLVAVPHDQDIGRVYLYTERWVAAAVPLLKARVAELNRALAAARDASGVSAPAETSSPALRLELAIDLDKFAFRFETSALERRLTLLRAAHVSAAAAHVRFCLRALLGPSSQTDRPSLTGGAGQRARNGVRRNGARSRGCRRCGGARQALARCRPAARIGAASRGRAACFAAASDCERPPRRVCGRTRRRRCIGHRAAGAPAQPGRTGTARARGRRRARPALLHASDAARSCA